jgi:hypothetical protein
MSDRRITIGGFHLPSAASGQSIAAIAEHVDRAGIHVTGWQTHVQAGQGTKLSDRPRATLSFATEADLQLFDTVVPEHGPHWGWQQPRWWERVRFRLTHQRHPEYAVAIPHDDLALVSSRFARRDRTAPVSRPALFQTLEHLTATAADRGVLIVDSSVDEQNLSVRIDFAIQAHQARFDDLTATRQLAREYTGPVLSGWDWGYDAHWSYLPWWVGVLIRPHASRFCTCIPVSDLPEVIHRLQLPAETPGGAAA